jgi:hypothetical protein
MLGIGATLVRCIGAGLVLAGVLKAVAFAPVAAWFEQTLGLAPSVATVAALAVICVELAVGAGSIAWPMRTAPVAGALFAAFLAVHGAIAMLPGVEGCPCLGGGQSWRIQRTGDADRFQRHRFGFELGGLRVGFERVITWKEDPMRNTRSIVAGSFLSIVFGIAAVTLGMSGPQACLAAPCYDEFGCGAFGQRGCYICCNDNCDSDTMNNTLSA